MNSPNNAHSEEVGGMPTLVPGTLPTVTLMDPGPRWISSTCRLVPGLEET